MGWKLSSQNGKSDTNGYVGTELEELEVSQTYSESSKYILANGLNNDVQTDTILLDGMFIRSCSNY